MAEMDGLEQPVLLGGLEPEFPNVLATGAIF